MDSYYLKEKEMSDDDYENMLTDIYGTVNICGNTYDQGYVFREMDPTGFRCGKGDFEYDMEDVFVCNYCESEYDDEYDADMCCDNEKKLDVLDDEVEDED